MPRWDGDGGRVKQTIFECAAFKYSIRATCNRVGCHHNMAFNPYALWWLFSRKGWDDNLRAAGKQLRCGRCGGRGARLEPVTTEPTVENLPLPPRHEWARAVNRFRS